LAYQKLLLAHHKLRQQMKTEEAMKERKEEMMKEEGVGGLGWR
jgi:hypothetical protein